MNIAMSKPLALMSAPQKRKAHHWYLTGLWVSSTCQGRADPHSVLPLVLTLEVRRSNSAADGTKWGEDTFMDRKERSYWGCRSLKMENAYSCVHIHMH